MPLSSRDIDESQSQSQTNRSQSQSQPQQQQQQQHQQSQQPQPQPQLQTQTKQGFSTAIITTTKQQQPSQQAPRNKKSDNIRIIILCCIGLISLSPLISIYVDITNQPSTTKHFILSSKQQFIQTLKPFHYHKHMYDNDDQLPEEKQQQQPGINISNDINNVSVNETNVVVDIFNASIIQQQHVLNDIAKNSSKKIGYRGILNCEPHGGPADASDMVYWKHIPSDNEHNGYYNSPYYDKNHERFLTFEADESGWNNVRMAFETTVALAIAMGRTLVLPPKQHWNSLWEKDPLKYPISVMGYEDFYHNLDNMHGLKVISFQEFLETYVMVGKLINPITGLASYPPMKNRTDWTGLLYNYDSVRKKNGKILYKDWLRQVTMPLKWNGDACVAAFPSKSGPDGVKDLEILVNDILDNENKTKMKWWQRANSYINHPTPVNASAKDRLREMLTNRRQLCIYNEQYQNADVVHVYGEEESGYRILIHFYAFIYIENYEFDLYIKRFIRDKLRFIDSLHCAAGRVVHKLKQLAGNDGTFDTMHIRRNDFKSQYADVVIDSSEIYYNNTINMISDKRTVYISTDETHMIFFNVLNQHYQLFYLNDFLNDDIDHLLKDIIPNFYGIIEQIIASKGTTFIGTYYSTFSGYINRIRGYYNHSVIDGSTKSYYMVPKHLESQRNIMTYYTPIEYQYWCREFPIGWRDLDHDLTII